MAALNRTFPLTQINNIAMSISHHLNFNMTGLLDIFFDKDSGVTKTRPRFIGCPLKAVAAISLIPGHTHTLTTAASRRLKHNGITHSGTDLNRMIGIAHHIGETRNTVNTGFFGYELRGNFIAHRLNGFFAWANKHDTRSIQCIMELAVLRQETISRMHCVSTTI